MTGARGEEYVTDVPYVRAFVGDLSPLTLRLVAALNGFPPPAAEDFAYCELGCAHGDTTATLAAAYPRARFFGVDINPRHIASANRLAFEGKLENIRFLEKDFQDLTRGENRDLPELDFVTAHGVLSWIGPAKRKALLDLASARLKQGGLLYVGYNALPGWASVEPLRQLMLDRGAAVGGSSLERAREGIAFAKILRDGGAAYFRGNPAAGEMLATMERSGLAYVVHEYLHAHWVPMYFSQVAAEMAESDLYFVGQLPLHLNYRDLAVPASLASVFNSMTDRLSFETLKDYATNQFFRRDVFIKGRVARDEAAAAQFLDTTPFGTLTREGPAVREVSLPYHTLHFAGPIYDALLPLLAEGATAVNELAWTSALAPFGPARVREAIVRLALAGQTAPTVEPTTPAPRPSARLRIPSPYNRMMLAEAGVGNAPIVLASSVAGTGIPLPRLDAVALQLLTEVAEANWPDWIEAFVQQKEVRLTAGGQVIEDNAERSRIVRAQVENFRAERLPRLIELGIVADEAATPDVPI